MSRNVASRLNTATLYLKELIADVSKGEVKVPKFQRPFVWRGEQALSLMDSIACSFPVGSLLLWKTNDKLIAERDIGDFRLPETDDLTPTLYVLDGQQRITVIYSCLASDANEGFAIGYDLVNQEFIELPEEDSLHVFPLRLTFATSSLLNFRTALQAHSQHELLQERLDLLIDAITSYKVPVVTLKELTVEEVCPIFERINSSGTRLSTYDLMVAATWSEEFDLDDEASTITAALDPKGFGDVESNTVLKCVSAVQNRSIKKEDVLALRELECDRMKAAVGDTSKSMLRAVDLLSTEFGIQTWDFLPYEAIVVVLSSLFNEVGGSLGSDQIQRVRKWFWRSAFDQRYRGASESFISRDIRHVIDYVANDHGSPEQFGVPPSPDSLMRTAFRSNNSRSRALILALASKGPRNLTNGAVIDVANALSSYNKKQFHHIFPRAHLRRTNAHGEHNSLSNICILAASENLAISDADPCLYLPQCIESHGENANLVFDSNLLPSPLITDYRSYSYSDFLCDRAELLNTAISRLCGGDPLLKDQITMA